MTDTKDVKQGFSLLNTLYIVIFFFLHWDKPIGSIPVWEFVMLWLYVVLIPTMAILLILLVVATFD